MTEQFKLHVFIHVDPESNLRFVFVCDDNNERLMNELHGCCINIIDDFRRKNILDAIDMCESDMFSKKSKCFFISQLYYRYERGP